MRILKYLLLLFLYFEIAHAGKFAIKANYVGDFKYFFALGDVNRNGKTETYEYYFTSDSDNGVRIREWNEDFSFTEIGKLPFFVLCWDIGDVNGDGLFDLVAQSGNPVANEGYLRVYTQRNRTGFPDSLIAEVVLCERKTINFAQFFDFDNDGAEEIILSANGENDTGMLGGIHIYKWRNNRLELLWASPMMLQIHYRAIGDFNRNGKIEIAVLDPNWRQDSVVVCSRSAKPVSAYNTKSILGHNVYGLAEKPLRSHHSLAATVQTGNDSALIRVFEDTDGTFTHFQEIWQYQYIPIVITSPTFAWDYNGDKNKDFVVCLSTDGDGFHFLVFNYTDHYFLSYDVGGTNKNIYGWTTGNVGDFEGDGKDDLIFSDQPYTRVYSFSNNNDWYYETLHDSIGFAYYTPDFNKNGLPELYCVLYISSDTRNIRRLIIYEFNKAPVGNLSDDRKNKIPFKTTLSQNYSNPFNSQTVINYSLPIAAFVELEIYDINGRKVRKIAERKSAGSHRYVFNAAGLPSGIYFYRLKLNGKISATKKMIFIK